MDFYLPLSGGLSELRASAEKDKIPIISRSTETLLTSIVKIKKPENILEIGTAVGYSAAFFAEAAEEACVVSIEKSEKMYRKAVENIEMLGLSGRVKVVHGDGETVIPELFAGDAGDAVGKFDFVFIDAAKSRYRQYFDAAVRVCAGGAVIISDNISLNGTVNQDEKNVRRRNRTSLRRMKEYIEYLFSLKNADTSIISTGDGVALTVIKRVNENES